MEAFYRIGRVNDSPDGFGILKTGGQLLTALAPRNDNNSFPSFLDDLGIKAALAVFGSINGDWAATALELFLSLAITLVAFAALGFIKVSFHLCLQGFSRKLFSKGAKAPSLPNKDLPLLNCSRALVYNADSSFGVMLSKVNRVRSLNRQSLIYTLLESFAEKVTTLLALVQLMPFLRINLFI